MLTLINSHKLSSIDAKVATHSRGEPALQYKSGKSTERRIEDAKGKKEQRKKETMTLTVLTDDEIRLLLENLTQDELLSFRDGLKAALHEYSTGTQKPSGWKSIHQPERTSIHNDVRGTNTLFMPSAGPDGLGIKVVTLSTAQNQDDTAQDAPPIIKPTGAITLFSPQGTPVGLLHASTLTAFRTALASVCLVSKRASIRTLTVFGCGEQAYWHVRLALLLRGSTIRTVNIINRRFSPAAKALLKRFYSVPASTKSQEGWTDCEFGVLTQGYGEYDRLLEEQVRDADVIFCCTPSTEPLFRAEILTDHEGRKKGRLVVAIGSYTPSMHEIPVGVIHQAVKRHSHHEVLGGLLHLRHAAEGGVIIVDTLDGLKEAGELIDAGLEPGQVVELGELVMLNGATQDGTGPGEVGAEEADDMTVTSEMLDKFDLGSDSSLNTIGGSSSSDNRSTSMSSAMSSVYGGGASGSGNGGSSRTSSPTRKSSLAAAAALFHRKSHSRADDGHGGETSPPSHHESVDSSSVEAAHPVTGNNGAAVEAAESKHKHGHHHGHHKEKSKHKNKHQSETERLAMWLSKGNVIYKSVGLGLMDLTVGMHLVKYAQERGVGTTIQGF